MPKCSAKNRRCAGGDEWCIGGTLRIEDGATLDVAEGATVNGLTAGGGGGLVVNFTMESENTLTADVDVETIAAAVHSGTNVCGVLMLDGFFVLPVTVYVPSGVAEGVSAMVVFQLNLVTGNKMQAFNITMNDGFKATLTATLCNLDSGEVS